jgi:membrane associated rhomboid family serine protease
MLLLLPLDRKLDWKNPPAVTLLLVIINTLIFFFWQGPDDRRWDETARFYYSSPLPAIELPAYAAYLEQSGERDEAARVRRALKGDKMAREMVLASMVEDNVFQRRLRQGEIVRPEHERYEEWKTARSGLEKRLANIVTLNYSLHRDRPVTHLTSMFLHADFGHLFGNMLFLFIVGFTVERILGHARFLAFYLLGGLSADALWVTVYEDLSALGASGAISAVMAMYAVLFGLRKIRFFYWIVLYFDYVRAPALILLPLWLLNELFGLYRGSEHIGYVAHIGGLLGGAALGWISRRGLKTADNAYLDEPARLEQRNQDMARGLAHMGALEFDKARHVFSEMVKRDPSDREALLQLYRVAKTRPEGDEYHALARKLLLAHGGDDAGWSIANEVFAEYSTQARPGPRLTREELTGLAEQFARRGYLASAERILKYLLKQPPAQPASVAEAATAPSLARGPRLDPIAECLWLLAEGFRRDSRADRHAHYVRLLTTIFPDSEAAVRAKRALNLPASQPPRAP